MFQHRADETPETKVVLHWFLLCFNGGCINAGGFMATGRFVSHVTGFATLFGVGLTKEASEAWGLLSVPVFFLIGAFLAGLLIDRQIHRGLKPHVDWVMGLSALCLLVATGYFFQIEHFGDEMGFGANYLLLAMLCLASGLQNAAITSSSGSTVRTTHMTGLTTDLGLGLARAFTFGLSRETASHESRANLLRGGSILSFVVGSAAGAFLFLKFGYAAFLGPAAIAAYAAWHGRLAKIVAHRPH